LRLNPKKADGTPGRIDGAVSWAEKQADGVRPLGLTFEPAFVNDDETQGQDPMATWVRAPSGEFGTSTVTATADIDLGQGEDRIDEMTGMLDILVPEEDTAFFEIAAEGTEQD
jgi:hypothetical protein